MLFSRIQSEQNPKSKIEPKRHSFWKIAHDIKMRNSDKRERHVAEKLDEFPSGRECFEQFHSWEKHGKKLYLATTSSATWRI